MLMTHVQAIVDAILYSKQDNIFGVAPVCFVPTFEAAKVVLAREREALRKEGEVGGDGGHGGGEGVARCVGLDGAIQRHLDSVVSRKIGIKMDI